jgi:hypothetical protein
VCASISPGSTVWPGSEIVLAPGGFAAGFTAAMRSPSTTMTAGDTTRPATTST